MAKDTTIAVPLGNYPNGNYGPFERNLPHGVLNLQIAFRRCTTADNTIWPNQSTQLTVEARFSYDGGTTYTAPGRFVMGPVGGGIRTGRDGEVAQQTASFSPGLSEGTPNRLQVFATVTGGPLRTEGTITIDI